jgi:hypothetical protein
MSEIAGPLSTPTTEMRAKGCCLEQVSFERSARRYLDLVFVPSQYHAAAVTPDCLHKIRLMHTGALVLGRS